MRLHRKLLTLIALGALLGAGGCSTNRQGDDASPVYLTATFTLLPLDKNVASGTFLQFQSTSVNSVLKAPQQGSSPFLDTNVEDYVVSWSRIDGGKTASSSETFGGNLLVPAGGSASLNNYPFMSPANLLRPPLDQLFPYNGGVDRETGNTIIRQKGVVIFRGHTSSGQPVASVPAYFDMAFFYAPPAQPRLQGLAIRPLAPSR